MKNKIGLILLLGLAFYALSFAQETGLSEDTQEENNHPDSAISRPNAQNKISLDVKGMDIVDVLKILATRSGINIVIGKNVTGRVTLFLKDVDINDAFEIVILANDLAYDKKGKIVNVMTSRDYEMLYGNSFADKKQILSIQLKYAKSSTLAQVLNQVKSNIGRVVMDEPTNSLIIVDTPEKLAEIKSTVSSLDRPLETKVFNLNYAQADKLNPKLQEAITKGIGSLKIDERTNKIAFTDYPEKIKDVSKIISAFDEKPPQVLIDAQIVEINPKKDQFALGVDWDYWLRKNARLVNSMPVAAFSNGTAVASKIALGVAAGGDTTNPVNTLGDYKTIIQALRVIGQTKILSSPRIMVLNNQEAKILVGTKDAYITSTTSQGGSGTSITSQSVNFVDVGIKLYVTPTINRDGFVTIKVRPEVSSSTRTNITSQGQITQIPIVSTSETETTIMIKDGTTIIIAGLKKDSRINEEKRIPLFGDIPLVGNFFKNRVDEKQKTELVIFITPHIVSGEESLEYSSLTQDRDIIELQKKAQAQDKQTDYQTADFKNMSEYKESVFNKIRREFINLKQEGVSLSGETKVSFVLDRNGGLLREPLVLSSNNENLRLLAVRSIKMAAPFPTFPDFVEKDQEAFEEVFKID